MNRGLIRHALRETRAATLLCGLGVLVFTALLSWLLPAIHDDLAATWLRSPFARTMVGALLGSSASSLLGPRTLHAIIWVHPFTIALISGHAIICCTRVPAGEIDRGTIDLLLGLPVSRLQLYLHETLAWILGGSALMALAVAGSLLGGLGTSPERHPGLGALLLIAGNLGAFYLAIGGLTQLLSALSNHRGRAMAGAFTIVLAAYLLNFLAQLWEPARALSFLSVVAHIKPLPILLGGGPALGDFLALALVGAASWALGAVCFTRRDIRTA